MRFTISSWLLCAALAPGLCLNAEDAPAPVAQPTPPVPVVTAPDPAPGAGPMVPVHLQAVEPVAAPPAKADEAAPAPAVAKVPASVDLPLPSPVTQKAEIVLWDRDGATIDTPLLVSTATAVVPRAIEFPTAVKWYYSAFGGDGTAQSASPFRIEHRDRLLFITLNDAAFEACDLTVTDVDQNVYILHLRLAADGETPASRLIIRPAAKVQQQQRAAGPVDTDGQVVHIFRAMGLHDFADPLLSSAPLFTYDRNKRYPGQVLRNSDADLKIVAMRQWVGMGHIGLETVWIWQGSKPLVFPLNRVNYPGFQSAAVWSSDLIQKTLDVRLPPHGATVVFLLGDAGAMQGMN